MTSIRAGFHLKAIVKNVALERLVPVMNRYNMST